MNEIVLAGCASTPLAGYLKALGVLRLLSAAHPDTRAAWRGSYLAIQMWSHEAMESFFLHDYQPTPVMAPWNGGSGFYEKDNKVALDEIRRSTNLRLALYRECLDLGEQALSGLDRSSSPKDTAKVALLRKLRGLLPDSALDWFDASVLLSGDSAQYPPLLGTGGNDGRLDFTNNFMQRLGEVLSLSNNAPSQESIDWLRTALYGEPAPRLVKKAIGQFFPGQVGGPNATTGYEADSVINPWDFILMIEGALPFAASAVRRNADDPEGILSYPFTVRSVSAGAGNLGEGDAASARGELWMPLWQQPATYPEIRALLAEGRVALGRKPTRDALDFVRAVHRLGCYRGVDSFQRYSLLMRSGKAYLATPLARIKVTENPKTKWLDELDQHDWLNRFRRFAQGENVTRRFLVLRKQLEDALFDIAGHAQTPTETQAFLKLLGNIQAALATSKKAQEFVPPVPRLSEQWVLGADDGTAAFRIARAVAGLQGTKNAPLPLRAQLFPVHPKYNTWMESARKAKGAASEPACRLRIHTASKGSLLDTLIALLCRRLWLAEQFKMPDKPLRSPAGINLDDLLAFLSDDSMDQRITELLPGMSLCNIPGNAEHTAGEGIVPAAFAMLKLCFIPELTLCDLSLLNQDHHVPVPPGLLAQLAAGNSDNRAVRVAWRRLRASGMMPLFTSNALPELGAIPSRRAAAALLIPLNFGAIGTLGRSVLESKK